MQQNGSREKAWVGTWAAAQQLVEEHNMPPEPGLANNTLRQVIRVSLGGEKIRLKFSNEYGNSPLHIKAAQLAVARGGSAIDTSSLKEISFGGDKSVSIAPGEVVVSDTLDYELPGLTTMAITLYFGEVPADLTGHPGSRTTSYIMPGKALAAREMSTAICTDHWYIISGLDILSEDPEVAAVVALGDSITDGRGSTTNGNDRWTDVLADRLQADSATVKIGVLNQGIGGNRVLRGGLGPTALSRFERDVLDQSGVRYLIVFEGVNDIGEEGHEVETAEELIQAYRLFIEKAHEQGILVYGATILPFGGSQYDNKENEETRLKVNHWIRNSGAFDAVLDFAAAVEDPEEPGKLYNLYDCGDHLHLSPAGYKKLAETIDLALFRTENR